MAAAAQRWLGRAAVPPQVSPEAIAPELRLRNPYRGIVTGQAILRLRVAIAPRVSPTAGPGTSARSGTSKSDFPAGATIVQVTRPDVTCTTVRSAGAAGSAVNLTCAPDQTPGPGWSSTGTGR